MLRHDEERHERKGRCLQVNVDGQAATVVAATWFSYLIVMLFQRRGVARIRVNGWLLLLAESRDHYPLARCCLYTVQTASYYLFFLAVADKVYGLLSSLPCSAFLVVYSLKIKNLPFGFLVQTWNSVQFWWPTDGISKFLYYSFYF